MKIILYLHVQKLRFAKKNFYLKAIEKTDINNSEEVRVTTPFCYETPKCQKTDIWNLLFKKCKSKRRN
jgi:hypothetical protein